MRRIIDINQNKFNLLKDRLSLNQTQSGFPIHPLPVAQVLVHSIPSCGTPSITSNTDLLEAASKQALVSNDTDERQSISSPEPTGSFHDPSNYALTYTTGPLSAALINYHHHHHQPQSSNHVTSNPSSINDRTDIEHDSMFTAPTSFNREMTYPNIESPNDAPPIFRNILHVAIIYGTKKFHLFIELENSFHLIFD